MSCISNVQTSSSTKNSTSPSTTTTSHPDLLEPHILRSLSDIKATSIHTSCAGCHFVVLDINGVAWLFGRNGFSCLGVSAHDHESVSENAPLKITPSDLGAPNGTRWVYAACGRNHTLLVGSDGGVWSAGANSYGQVRARLLFLSFGSAMLIFPGFSAAIRCPPRLERSSL